MKYFPLTTVVALVLFAPAAVWACVPTVQNPGTYTTTDLGGRLLTGRASTWRPGINSGLPNVLHAQSWNGSTLGAQWELRCPVENSAIGVVDNRVGGVGTVVYTSTFTGGQLELFSTGEAWGDGVADLGTTIVISTVQFINIANVSTPVASVLNASTSGQFGQPTLCGRHCVLTFVVSNGVGVGETTSLDLSITRPATYPDFLDASCLAAPGGQQFGTWGNTLTTTMRIDCTTSTTAATWGKVKSQYR